MRSLFVLASAVLLLPSAAQAQSTRTTTYDGRNYDATRTVTRDPTTGQLSRDTSVTRASDGATASHSFDRQRTDTGVTRSGSTTNFQGQTRGYDYARTRTDTGYTASGSATRFNGDSYGYSASGRRGPNGGYVRRQGVTNSDGELVAGRRVAVRRGPEGGVYRNVRGFRRGGR